MENITFYQQGDNEQSFKSIVRDTERNQGYINLYDLEIKNHPSFFAEGIAVHNCHSLTKDAQNALLKALEDTPPFVYFLLCTTNPENLLDTIKTRCTGFSVDSLMERQLVGMMKYVLEEEKIRDFPLEALKNIASLSLGSARTALVILDKIVELPDDQLIEAATAVAEKQSQTIELCRLLLDNKPKWERVAKIISQLNLQDSGVESTRRAIIGYLSSVLLKNGTPRVAYIMSCFMEPFFNTGKAGLVLACYMATQEQ